MKGERKRSREGGRKRDVNYPGILVQCRTKPQLERRRPQGEQSVKEDGVQEPETHPRNDTSGDESST